jgi:hypothetical protein
VIAFWHLALRDGSILIYLAQHLIYSTGAVEDILLTIYGPSYFYLNQNIVSTVEIIIGVAVNFQTASDGNINLFDSWNLPIGLRILFNKKQNQYFNDCLENTDQNFVLLSTSVLMNK